MLRRARIQRDEAKNDVETEAYQKLVGVYDKQVETLKIRVSELDSTSQEQKRKDAVKSAIRRMGKALPSKTLDETPELWHPIRDAVMKVLENDDQRQVFLAGIGSGFQDLTRPRKKKNRKNTGTEGDCAEDGAEDGVKGADGGDDKKEDMDVV
jgi:hypothetical protein